MLRVASIDFIMFQRGHHALELGAIDGLERSANLLQEKHLRRFIRTLDEVVRHALELERVVHAEGALLAGLIDQRDRLRLLAAVVLLSRHPSTSACRRGGPEEGAPRRRDRSTRDASRDARLLRLATVRRRRWGAARQ